MMPSNTKCKRLSEHLSIVSGRYLGSSSRVINLPQITLETILKFFRIFSNIME